MFRMNFGHYREKQNKSTLFLLVLSVIGTGG